MTITATQLYKEPQNLLHAIVTKIQAAGPRMLHGQDLFVKDR